jgi:6-phosphogluconolactonase
MLESPGRLLDRFVPRLSSRINLPSIRPMQHYVLKQLADDNALAQAAAEAWLDEVETATRAGHSFTVALSGGRIARKFYASTVGLAVARGQNFSRVHFFWADERCLPPTDPESNYRLAHDLLFAPLGIPGSHIHRVRGEAAPDVAAAEASAEIRRLAALNPQGLPALDLVILGLGEDGHVASLFPNAAENVTDSQQPYLAITDSPKPPLARVTLSYPVITAARLVWVLVSGQGKADALRKSLSPKGSTPLARVLRSRPKTRLFSDISAC